MRNPYAKSLRVKPQQVIPDKRRKLRDETDYLLASQANADRLKRSIAELSRVEQAMDDLRHLYNSTLEEPLPDDWQEMLDRLK